MSTISVASFIGKHAHYPTDLVRLFHRGVHAILVSDEDHNNFEMIGVSHSRGVNLEPAILDEILKL